MNAKLKSLTQPKDFRAYDNGGRSADRYTVLPARQHRAWQEAPGLWLALGANHEPFHPQGIGMTCSAVAGKHLGKKVAFDTLPADVQKCAKQLFNIDEGK
jgi:hypothetical protein